MNAKLLVAAALVSLSMTSHATASHETTNCSFSDLVGVTVSKCAGFLGGNLIDSSPSDLATVRSILKNTFGVSLINETWLEKIDGLNGAQTIDFTTPLSGDTIVALHFGNGRGGPGNGTAFYEFNAGSSLDSFRTIFRTSSNAAIYRTTSAVPEPATFALLLAGLGLMGGLARYRRPR